MTRGYIRYRSDYKYQLASEYRERIVIRPAVDITTDCVISTRVGVAAIRPRVSSQVVSD